MLVRESTRTALGKIKKTDDIRSQGEVIDALVAIYAAVQKEK